MAPPTAEVEAKLAALMRGIKLPTGQFCMAGHCMVTARYSLEHVYKGKGLHLVAGSLGIGKEDPWFEYGNPKHRTVQDFMLPDGHAMDVHIWLEDKDARVYDVVTPYMVELVAPFHEQQLDARSREVLEGVGKDALRERGLHYIAAARKLQAPLLRIMTKRAQAAYDRVLPQMLSTHA